jgi:hypothetical protein
MQTRLKRARLKACALMISGVLAGLVGTAVPAQAGTELELLGFTSQLSLDGTVVKIEKGVVNPDGSITVRLFPPSGFHTFTRAAPYWSFSDSNGSGSEQMSYSNNREQWGYKLSPAVQRIVVGTVNQLGDRYHGSQRLSYGQHIGYPPDYPFHGSSGGVESRGTYATTQRITFRHNVGSGGTGVVSAQWNWQRR